MIRAPTPVGDHVGSVVAEILDPGLPDDAVFRSISTAIPNELFTAMRFHAATTEVERIHSSRPEAYPVGGRKPKADTEWGRLVLGERRVSVGSGAAHIRWAFADHDRILSLGLLCVLNIPVLRGAEVLGTLNFLRRDPAFTVADQASGQLLAAALARRQSA